MPKTKIVVVRLTRHFYDEGGVFHPKGSVLTLPEDKAPKSARHLGKDEVKEMEREQKEARTLAEAADKFDENAATLTEMTKG